MGIDSWLHYEKLALFESHIDLVKSSAIKAAGRLSASSIIDYDDIYNAGLVGLWSAVVNHDASKGLLENYARLRIKGAILDLIRQNDFLSRRHREQIKINGDSHPVFVHIDEPSLDGKHTLSEVIPDTNSKDPSSSASNHEFIELISEYLKGLPQKKQQIINAYFF